MKRKILYIIDAIGERIGLDARYFAKNTFWLLFGQVLMSVSAFVITYVLANYVSKHNVGDYRLVVSFYTTITFFALSGMPAALIKSIVQGKDGALEEALKIKKKYGIIAFLVGLVVAIYFGIYRNNPLFGISILIMSICLPIMEAYTMYLSYLQGKHEFKYSSLSQSFVKIISSFAVACAAYFAPSTIYLILALYGTQAIVTYLVYHHVLKLYPPQNKEIDPTMSKYAKHVTLSGFGFLVFGQVDKFILYHFFGPVALAQFWIASTIPQEVGRVLGTVSQVAYPKFASSNHGSVKYKISKYILFTTIILFGVSCLYALVAYPFFNLFFPLYIDQVSKSIVLMFAFAIIPYSFVWQYYSAQGNVKVVYISNMVDPTLQFILYCIFIPLFGIWGLVYAMLSKMVCMNLLSWYIIRKY